MDYFPIFTELKDKPVLVVGGGEIAQRKVKLLIDAKAIIHIVAQKLNTDMQMLKDKQAIHHIATEFDAKYVDDVFLVIAATNNLALNAKVKQAADARFRFVNVVDQQELCSFITPSIIDRSPIMVAIASGGQSPVLVRRIREKLEAALLQHLGKMADIAGSYRNKVKERIKNTANRRLFWETLFDSSFEMLVANGREDEAIALLEAQLNQPPQKQGKVSLVGAGPGDSGLLTLKALQAMQSADIVYYDNLVSKEVLNLVRRDATLVSVAKKRNHHLMVQEDINKALIQSAKQGYHVVRLKGGDPYIYGRGAEEVAALKQANITYQVISGITAALGASAAAEIPLTMRHKAQALTFVTGHEQENNHLVNWENLADINHTLVIYMGLYRAGVISNELMKYGRPSDTPVAIVQNATRDNQQIFRGQLADLEMLSQQAQSPSLIIIGEVAKI